MGVKKNKGVKQKNEKKVADIKNGCQTAKGSINYSLSLKNDCHITPKGFKFQ